MHTHGTGVLFRAALLFSVCLAGTAPTADFALAAGKQGDGHAIVNHGLVGVGRLSASARDRFGDTVGSMSALTMDTGSWRREGDHYTGTLFALPDRGYNVEGTTDYTARLNRMTVTLKPYAETGPLSAGAGQQAQVTMSLDDTILLTDAAGTPTTGLDPVPGTGVRPAGHGFPELPQAYNGRVSLDPEGIARLADGSFYISDEYGPYIYHFSAEGRMLAAIQPPAALLPIRNGKLDFSSNNPAKDQPKPQPANPVTGRQNNQGLEGLSLTPDQTRLIAMLQSATRQDGGAGGKSATRRYTRLMVYDVAGKPDHPTLIGHYVVPLPIFKNGDKTLVAAQSELLALNDHQFLVLSRDSDNGQGLKGSESLYRSIDLVDISGATNLKDSPYEGTTPVAPDGMLTPSVTPASLTPFLNINDNAQLARFGLHNGRAQDADLLSEKWEALGLVPALDSAHPQDFFLFVGNDNDFLSRHGHQVGADYDAGADVDTMLLVYRLTLPGHVAPAAQ